MWMTSLSSIATHRHNTDPQARRHRLPLGMLLVLLALPAATTLAACTRVTAGGQLATHIPSAASATPGHLRPGGMALNSCASQAAPTDAGTFKPDVVVS